MVAPRMSIEELLSRIDDPHTTVIDVRRGQNKAGTKIKGAVVHDPEHVHAWAETYDEEQVLVLYCA